MQQYLWRALKRAGLSMQKQHGEANSNEPDIIIQWQ